MRSEPKTRVILRKAELFNAFRKYAHYDATKFILGDKHATELIYLRNGEKEAEWDQPEIDQEKLQKILLQSVPERYLW